MPVSTECAAALLSFRYPSLHLISYDDGLIDDGEFFLYDLDYSILEAVLFVAQLLFLF